MIGKISLIIILILSTTCCTFESANECYARRIAEMNSKNSDVGVKTSEWEQLCALLQLKYIDDVIETIPYPQEVLNQGGSDCVGYAILARATIIHEFHGYIICANKSISHAVGLYEDNRGFYITNVDSVERIDGENGYINLPSLSKYNKFVSEKIILDR